MFQSRIFPNELNIAFWDVYKSEKFFKKIVLKIYDIKKQRVIVRLKRNLLKPRNIHWLEDFESFLKVKWSPDGRYLAFSLTGKYVEIYDFKLKKIISKIDFQSKGIILYYGFFYIDWIDDNSLIVGYMSSKTQLPNTNDTYGIIMKSRETFEIEKPILPNESELIPDREKYFRDDNWHFNKREYPILIIKDKNIEKIKIIEESLSLSSEIYDLPKRDSYENIVLTISKSGNLAVIGYVKTDDKKIPQIYTKIIQIPKKYRDILLKHF